MDLLFFQNSLFALFLATLLAITISKLRAKKLKLPPGPICLPIFGNWLQVGNHLNHRSLADLSQKYGDLFLLRMGQRNLVNVCSPNLAKDVLQTQGIEFGSRTRNVVFDIFTGKGQDMIFTVYGEHWRKMRRIMTVPFFTNKVVHHYKQAWKEEATSLVDDLLKNPEASTVGIGIRRRLQLLMHNNVYRIMFSRRFEREDDPLFLKLYKVNEDRGRLAQSLEYNYGDFIPILRPFMRRYLNLCQQVCNARMQLFDYFVKQRKKEQKNTIHGDGELRCGIDHILEAQQKGEINNDNVLYAIENMNVAGIDTISRSIEWCIADLVNNPRVQKKLQDELDAVVGRGVQITEADLKNLPYLEAVIKETLRLRMAAPLLVPHMNLKDEKLGGYDIPAESRVSINGWWLANNPAHWKKPEEFRPERFLEEEINVEVHGNEFKYIPFGVGRRSCPGMVLAIPIFGITLGTLVKNFEMLAPPGEDKIDTTEKAGQFSLHILKPYNVVFKPRSS